MANQAKSLKIDVNFLTSTFVLFQIVDENTRERVLRINFWHIGDIPMVVREWSPDSAAQNADISSVPMWVDFKDVPSHLFSFMGLSFLASHIGVPVKLHPKTVKCLRLDVARVLIEVNLQNQLPKLIHLPACRFPEAFVHVTFPWLPPRCEHCSKWGHASKDCPGNSTKEVSILKRGSTFQSTPIQNSELSTVAEVLGGRIGSNLDIKEIVIWELSAGDSYGERRKDYRHARVEDSSGYGRAHGFGHHARVIEVVMQQHRHNSNVFYKLSFS